MEMKSEPIKVLLIEDDEDDYILTRELLSEVKGGNYALDWAASYEEGLKVAGRLEHHVCLVDYRLGERNGLELIREARAARLTTPMILLTGQGNHDVDMEAIEAGATDYLVKDETPASRLERTIRYAVQLNTERKQAELVRLQAAALESADNAILITSHEGTITWVNSAFTALTGYTPAEVIGQNPRILKSGRHDAAFYKSMWETLYSGEVWRGEMINLRKDGSTFIEEQTITPLLSETGEITNFIAIKKDITARKRIEGELEEARDAALESVRLKSEFLANMSHEIRTPMNGVIGMTSLLLDTELGFEQRRFSETIRSSAQALLKIINDILDFSKIEADELHFEMLEFDLLKSVESTLEVLSARAQEKHIELGLLFDRDVPRALRGDEGRLRQVLTNLIGNAVKFTERGEIIVHVFSESISDTHARLRFNVSDTGIGITQASQSRVFEAFSQADGSTTRKYGGTGLGLAISKRLVELMNGEIGFESNSGQGSNFWFTAGFEKQAEGSDVSSRDLTALTGRRMLIVDDSSTTRRSILDSTSSWGMFSVETETCAEALAMMRAAALRGEGYDIVAIDVELPDEDAFELARSIKGDPKISAAEILLMASLGMQGHGEQARMLGAAAYLTKPIRQSQLFDCLMTIANRPAGAGSSQDFPALVTRHSLRESKFPTCLQGRILIAEDNAVNMEVAICHMEKLGLHADMVANGLEAIEALAQIEYDVVLMDCQMPEMDGYAATAQIRRREGAKHRTPIIAMTANAMRGDRERCLEAGMDDYVSKPIDAAELFAVLRRWLPPIDKGSAINEEEPTSTTTALTDFYVTERLNLFEQEFSAAMVVRLIDKFLPDTAQRLIDLRTAVEAVDAQAVARAAHGLKGSYGNIGSQEAAGVCLQLEQEARSGSVREAEDRLGRLEEGFPQLTWLLQAQKTARTQLMTN
jgi:PAS domain S-box-containing protein